MTVLSPFQGVLAALADSDASLPFYAAAAYQLLILFLWFSPRVRATKSYTFAAGVSHLLLSICLVAGIYFATRPTA